VILTDPYVAKLVEEKRRSLNESKVKYHDLGKFNDWTTYAWGRFFVLKCNWIFRKGKDKHKDKGNHYRRRVSLTNIVPRKKRNSSIAAGSIFRITQTKKRTSELFSTGDSQNSNRELGQDSDIRTQPKKQRPNSETTGGSLEPTLSHKGHVNGEVTLKWNINGVNNDRKLPIRPPRTGKRWNNPATNARQDRASRKEALNRIGGTEGDKMTFVFLDSAGNPENVDVPVSPRNPDLYKSASDDADLRRRVREMCELNNKSPAKSGTDFITYWSDALPNGGMAALMKEERTFSIPVVIRQFGSIKGGIGRTDATMTPEGYFEHQIKQRMPPPYCQLQESEDTHVPYDELLEEFKKAVPDRKYTANVLGSSYMHDQAIIDGLQRPAHLQDDLLRYVAIDMKDAHNQWKGDARVLPEQGFCLVSMEGSYSLPHYDCLPTWVVNQGFKIWGVAKACEENIEIRKNWMESDGLSKFLDWRFILLYPGDLLIMRQILHTVYSPSDGLSWGGHWIDGETADATLKMAIAIQKYDVLTNHVPDQMENNLCRILQVTSSVKMTAYTIVNSCSYFGTVVTILPQRVVELCWSRETAQY